MTAKGEKRDIMKLRDLCRGQEYTLIQGSLDTYVSNIAYDSRKISEGDMFVCISGAVTDGHQYIYQALEKGASVIAVENKAAAEVIPNHITVIWFASARRALAGISAAYFSYPSERLTTIGITGTKGKTTTAYMIKSVMEEAGIKTGIMGTIEVDTGKRQITAVNTTPESYDIQKYMAEMVRNGCKCVVMEVSSQALKLHRTAGILFDCGIFTNISADHIGPAEHESFDEYLYCKSLLFRQCRQGFVNIDDDCVGKILEGHTCDIITFSVEKPAHIMASDIEFYNKNGILGMEFSISGTMDCRVQTGMPGFFSAYNALAAIAVCRELGIHQEEILEGIKRTHVKGRVEMVRISKDFSIIIDYAHNGGSTRCILETMRCYHPSRLTAVFGCGGNRSGQRRLNTGRIAGELADLCIVTCDNPRFENIGEINRDIKKGICDAGGRYIEIEDRREAIAYAITHAVKGEMIALLGKGHEDYIEIQGSKRHFSEHETIKDIVSEIVEGRRRFENPVSLLSEEDLKNS